MKGSGPGPEGNQFKGTITEQPRRTGCEDGSWRVHAPASERALSLSLIFFAKSSAAAFVAATELALARKESAIRFSWRGSGGND